MKASVVTAQRETESDTPSLDDMTDAVGSGVNEASDDARAECLAGGDTICSAIHDLIGNQGVAVATTVALQYVWRIALVLAIGAAALWLARRMIDRITESIAEGRSTGNRFGRAGVRALAHLDPLRGARRAQRARAVGQLLRNLASVVIFSIITLVLVGMFVQPQYLAPLLASASVIGVALGFGTQSLVRDFVSGIFMIIEDQYGVGDIIDVGDAVGTVEVVGLRVTRLRDIEGTVWYVRNGEIMRVGNQSQGWARAVLDIGVSYDTDVDKAIEVMAQTAGELYASEGWRDIMLDEPEVWGVQELADNAIMLRLVVRTAPLEQWKVARELRRAIRYRFDAEGITIPFPQQQVWINTDAPAQRHASPHAQSASAAEPAHQSAPATSRLPGSGESDAMTSTMPVVLPEGDADEGTKRGDT